VTTNVLYLDGGTATLQGPDAFGPFASRGNNLISRTDNSTGWVASDLTGTSSSPLDARLSALGNWGGLTETYRPFCDSPLRDAGDNTDASEWDQRGDGFYRIVNDIVDIGSYEVQHEEDCEPSEEPRPGSDGAGQFAVDDLMRVLAPARLDGALASIVMPRESEYAGRITTEISPAEPTVQQAVTQLEAGDSLWQSDSLSTDRLNGDWIVPPLGE
jgi:hypothetical protein